MATIGSLVIDLRADIANFSSNLAKAQRDTTAFANSAQRQLTVATRAIETGFSKVNRVLGVFGIALAAREVVNFGRGLLQAADTIQDMSRELGLSVQMLQALEYEAHGTGATTEQLVGTLARFAQTVGDAEGGSRQAIEALNRLGIKIKDVRGETRPMGDLIRDFAEGLKNTDGAARRLALGIDVAGKGLRETLPIFENGARGIDDALRDATAAGVAYGDEINSKLAEANASINQHIDRLKALASLGLGAVLEEMDRLAAKVQQNPWLLVMWGIGTPLPGTGDIVNAPQRLRPQLIPRDIADAQDRVGAAESAFMRAQNNLERAMDLGVATPQDLQDLANTADSARVRLDEARDALLGLRNTVGLTTPSGVDIAEDRATRAGFIPPTVGVGNPPITDNAAASRIADVAKNLRLLIDNLDRTNRDQAIFSELSKAGVSINTEVGRTIAALAGQYYDLSFAQKAAAMMSAQSAAAAAQEDDDKRAAVERGRQMITERDNAIGAIEREMTMRERLISALGEGNRAYEIEAKFQEIINSNRLISVDRARQLAEAYVEQSERLDQMTASANYLQDFGEQAFDRVGSAITEAFANGSLSALDFGGIVKGIFSEIAQMMLELSVLNPIKNWISGEDTLPTFATVFGGLFGSSGAAGASGGNMNIPQFAAGGYLGPGQLGIAGEEGPEFIYGGRSGMTVVPHDGGGSGVNVQIIDRRSSGARPQVRSDGNQVRIILRDELRNAVRNGTLDDPLNQHYGIRRRGAR